MDPVIGVRRLMGNRLDVAAQLVRDDDARLAKLRDQPCQKTLGSLGVAAALDKNVEHVVVSIDRPPEPVLHPIHRDHNLIQMPFVIRSGTVPPDAGRKMGPKAVDPEPDRFATHDHATLGKQILDVRRAQREAMVRPDSVGDDFTRMTIALQAWHYRRYFHATPCSQVCVAEQLGNATLPSALSDPGLSSRSPIDFDRPSSETCASGIGNMAKAYLLIAFALFLSSPSALTAETADATANALIVVASRDLAAAESLSEPDVAGLMERLTLISSARSAVKKVLEEHDTSALAVRIALGEIPKLSLKSLDAALQESRVSLAQGITRCPDQRACLLNLAEGIAYKLVDAKARSRAFSGMSIGLRDVSRMPKVISFIKSNSTLSQSDIDTQTGSFLLEFANVLAVDGQVETAVSVLENIPESERSWTIPSFATNLLDLGNFDAAARLAEHPSLDAVGRDALAGHLLIFSAQMGDSDAAVFWLKQFIDRKSVV